MPRLRVLVVVVHGELELLDRVGEVPLAIGLHALGEVDARLARGILGDGAVLLELGVVGLPPGWARQDVHGFREELELVLRRSLFFGLGEAIRVVLARQHAELVPDLRLGGIAGDPEHVVVIRHRYLERRGIRVCPGTRWQRFSRTGA